MESGALKCGPEQAISIVGGLSITQRFFGLRIVALKVKRKPTLYYRTYCALAHAQTVNRRSLIDAPLDHFFSSAVSVEKKDPTVSAMSRPKGSPNCQSKGTCHSRREDLGNHHKRFIARETMLSSAQHQQQGGLQQQQLGELRESSVNPPGSGPGGIH